MFTNPLKYQNGGAVQAREQVVNAISEIAQIPAEEVNLKLDQISQDQESIQLLSEALQAVQKGDERGYQVIKQMFNPQATDTGIFAKGGKIQTFICKHAKGGNVKECGCGGKTEKYQNPAGPIGRREALEAAKKNYGFDDAIARRAYASWKNTLRKQGLRGSELRQKAREIMMTPPKSIAANVNINDVALNDYEQPNIDIPDFGPEENNNWMVRTYDSGNFSDAFKDARENYLNGGQDVFFWNNNIYSTDLAKGSRSLTEVNPTVDKMISGAIDHFKTTAPSTIGAISYDGYKNIGDNLKAFWRDLTGKKENGGAIVKNQRGKVEKAQDGTRSLYQQITADGPETYTDGYGTVRQMNESPIIAGLRKAYHWINMDRTLSDNAYSQKHGYSKPLTGMPPAVYISPVAQEIELAKIIGNRIPKQKPTIRISENLGNGKFSAIDDFGKPVIYDADQIIDKNTFKPEPGFDWDIDKRYGQSLSMIEPTQYNFSKLGRITISWPEFIGKTALKWAPGIVGSAALGSYIATKKDKKKNSGGGGR